MKSAIELSSRELNEIIYCIEVARKHGELLGTTTADKLQIKLLDELINQLSQKKIK